MVIIFLKILACEIKGKSMSISYNGLWKMLNDENMYKKGFSSKTEYKFATIVKMGNGENVSQEVLLKIC